MLGSCDPFPFGVNFFRAGLRVNVKKAVKGGVFAIGENEMTTAPMTVRLVDPVDGRGWFLHFDPSAKKCPGSNQVVVRGVGPGTWEVEATAATPGCLQEPGGPNAPCGVALGVSGTVPKLSLSGRHSS